MTRASYTINVFESLEAIPREDWAPLCYGGFPFTDYAYLHALGRVPCPQSSLHALFPGHTFTKLYDRLGALDLETVRLV